MTLNDLELQNRGFLWIFWRFRAATQIYIIHNVAPRYYPDREFGICMLS